MTDRQRLVLLRSAVGALEKTKQGHVQWAIDKTGLHWKEAIRDLRKLENDLKQPIVPDLGAVFLPGRSVLLHDLTHATAGIPLYPAFDDAFAQGTVIIAPESMQVIAPMTSSSPGKAFYAQGRSSKIRYWFGHLDRTHAVGTKFAKGDAVGKVAANNVGGGPHVHVGINVELLLGAGTQLIHNTNYTHGAPTVGLQLAKSLT